MFYEANTYVNKSHVNSKHIRMNLMKNMCPYPRIPIWGQKRRKFWCFWKTQKVKRNARCMIQLLLLLIAIIFFKKKMNMEVKFSTSLKMWIFIFECVMLGVVLALTQSAMLLEFNQQEICWSLFFSGRKQF